MLSLHLPEGTEESWTGGRDLNPKISEYESGVLTIRLRRSLGNMSSWKIIWLNTRIALLECY